MEEHRHIIKMRAGDGYTSPVDLYNNGQVKQFKDLTKIKNIYELKDTILNYDTSKYHIIRIDKTDSKSRDRIVIENLKSIFNINEYLFNNDSCVNILDFTVELIYIYKLIYL